MTSRKRNYVGFFAVTALLALSCSGAGDDTISREPLEPGRSRPEESPLANTFATEIGDAAAAYVRARARFAQMEVDEPARAPAVVDPSTVTAAGTLVLYDTTNTWGWLGELYAMNVGSLSGRFGAWSAKPVSKYAAGEMLAYANVVYVGSTFDEPLPVAMLDDVLAGSRPVVWIDHNIWQLAARAADFKTAYGFEPWVFDFSSLLRIDYKGTSLTRHPSNGNGLMTYSSLTTASVLADAVKASDGTKMPWAVRGKNLTYIGENPMAYVTSNDRYLAFCDLLIDAFAPSTTERHRALVRIEDVSAETDPAALQAIADYLSSESVPFGIALIPFYQDPNGYYSGGRPERIHIKDAPAVVSALKYAGGKGGTIVLHGYTHQWSNVANPYSGVSADDFEFYRAHVDAANYVVYDGPVPNDSQKWAEGRISSALSDVNKAGLPRPAIFEFPHYAGSAADARAVRKSFATAYHRGLYFSGTLAGTAIDYTHQIGVVYPYVGRDPYGFKVLPETMGSYEPDWSNNNPPRVVADLLETARVNKVVRDGFASFYFHPYYDIAVLKQIVAGVKANGYTFVSPTSL
jgi:uncharacterized protein YdaL